MQAMHPPAVAAATDRLIDLRLLRDVFIAALAIKLVLLMLDPHVRLFMGDSATYLGSAVKHTTPPDRSFTYPILIRLTAGVTGSITTLLILQTLAGVAAAVMLCHILRSAFRVRRWLAASAAIVLALEPSQLFYERMIMTEVISSCVLLASLAAAITYLQTMHLRWLLLCVFLGVALASLRVGLVPVALALAPAAALLGAGRQLPFASRRPASLKWVAHVLVALVATGGCHHAYKLWYASRAGGEPAYIRDAGIYQLGLVAPLIKPEYFAGTGVDPSLLGEVELPLADPRLREGQIWSPHGLASVLRHHLGDGARDLAGVLAARAMHDQPLRMLSLGLVTTLDYFQAVMRAQRLSSDLGSDRATDAVTLQLLRENFHYDAEGLWQTPSLVWTYFALSSPWLIVCLFGLAPAAIAVLAMRWRRQRDVALLLTLLCLGLVFGQVLCAHIISFRYLHPLPMLLLLCAAVIIDSRLSAQAGKRMTQSMPG